MKPGTCMGVRLLEATVTRVSDLFIPGTRIWNEELVN